MDVELPVAKNIFPEEVAGLDRVGELSTDMSVSLRLGMCKDRSGWRVCI